MVSIAQVQAGVARYLENEIVAKITDWRKWVIGAGASMALGNVAGILSNLKANPIVNAMGVIDENDMIDIDRLHEEFSRQAQRGAITFDVPMLGAVTLNAQDVDKLYHYIIS